MADSTVSLKSASAEVYQRFKQDKMLWAHYYFPHHMRMRSPAFHLEMLKLVQEHRFAAIAAPRESSKSTVITFLDNFHDIIFKRSRFILMISNTFKKAAMNLETMKKELRENEQLLDNFPGITIAKDAEGDSDFRHVEDGYTTKVLCKGVDQMGSVRGVKFGAYRPDKINLDDVEDDELVLNPERRYQLKREFDEALIPAGEKDLCRYVAVGTLLHDDALMADLVNPDLYPEWAKLIYKGLIDENTVNERSLWPEKWSLEYLHWLREHKPTVFAKEIQNDPVAGGLRRFDRKDFRYWRRDKRGYTLYDQVGEPCGQGLFSDCVAGIACDLAWKEKREADSTVIFPGFLTPERDYLFLKPFIAKGVRPDKLAETLFEMELRLRTLTGRTVPVGFEKAMLETVQQWLLKREMRERNHWLTFRKLSWDVDKLKRIEVRLQPLYSQNVVYHERDMGEYEHQLERFPSGTHEDAPDAAQGLVQVLQHPRARKDPSPKDDAFERLRKFAKTGRRPTRPGMFQIQGRGLRQGIPAQQSPL